GAFAWWRYGGSAAPASSVADAPRVERIVPDSLRIKVEVLNGTDIRGLARRGSFLLRDLGFDVVGTGNASEPADTTTIYVRSGREDWAQLAASGLGGARVIARPDSSRYLDLTIVLGRTWRPPAEAFHP
ncbi:MAG TPA: LytR C-terminal domain-containing protein, partial [Gemmatimonadaceae bacterium]|nr:LytR C-terminal domain-containing protein [Gemmatimonadaceae bacterium]